MCKEITVFVNGVFDIIHPGHIKLLKYAKELSEKAYVMVAIDSDERVKELKGPSRPINNLESRRTVLNAIKYVDVVLDFSSEADLLDILYSIQPDVMVKGSDYRNRRIVGATYCKEIHFVDLTDDSTTKTIQRIIAG